MTRIEKRSCIGRSDATLGGYSMFRDSDNNRQKKVMQDATLTLQ